MASSSAEAEYDNIIYYIDGAGGDQAVPAAHALFAQEDEKERARRVVEREVEEVLRRKGELLLSAQGLEQKQQSQNRLERGSTVRKKLGTEKDYNERFIFVSEDLHFFCWSKSAAQRYLAKTVPLAGLQLRRGPPGTKHKRDAASGGFGVETFSLMLTKKREGSTAIDLRCETASVCEAWVCRLGALLHMLHYPEDAPREPQYTDRGTYEEGTRPFSLALVEELTQGSVVRFFERSMRPRRQKTPQELASFRDHPMMHPLTELHDSLHARAVEAFSTVMVYMGDLNDEAGGSSGSSSPGSSPVRFSSPKSQAAAVKYALLLRLANMGIACEDLRDEIYLQLIKQTTDNPTETSLVRGWQLIVACLHAFVPEDDALHSCLLLHADRARLRSDAVGGLAYYAYCLCMEGRGWKRRDLATPELLSELHRKFVPSTSFHCSLEEVLRREGVLRVQALGAQPEQLPALGALLQCRTLSAVPEVLQVLVRRFQELDGSGVDGVFRRAADTDRVASLKKQLDESGSYVAYGTEAVASDEVLVIADLIKIWLRSLNEPLIPLAAYDRAIEAGKATTCQPARDLLLTLPPANVVTLRYLLRFLNGCADQAHRNQMTRLNLALVFTPNILHNPGDDPRIMMQNSDLERRFVSHLMDAVRAMDEQEGDGLWPADSVY